MLGLQLLKKNQSPILPEKILNIRLRYKSSERIEKVSRIIICWTKKITKPRLEKFISVSLGVKFQGIILIAGGVLMAIPFGVHPFNNFFPGLAILFASIAQFEKDGLFILIAIFWLFFSVVYFIIFFITIYYIGLESIQYIPEWFSELAS